MHCMHPGNSLGAQLCKAAGRQERRQSAEQVAEHDGGPAGGAAVGRLVGSGAAAVAAAGSGSSGSSKCECSDCQALPQPPGTAAAAPRVLLRRCARQRGPAGGNDNAQAQHPQTETAEGLAQAAPQQRLRVADSGGSAALAASAVSPSGGIAGGASCPLAVAASSSSQPSQPSKTGIHRRPRAHLLQLLLQRALAEGDAAEDLWRVQHRVCPLLDDGAAAGAHRAEQAQHERHVGCRCGGAGGGGSCGGGGGGGGSRPGLAPRAHAARRFSLRGPLPQQAAGCRVLGLADGASAVQRCGRPRCWLL